MKKIWFGLLVLVVLLASGFLSPQQGVVRAGTPKVLEFETMRGVPRAYIASRNVPIRGVNGGGLPWVVGSAHGELSTAGKLEVQVSGLVFDPADPEVITRGLAGRNTVSSFRAIVSCQSVDAEGNASVVNLITDAFPATVGLASAGGGNAKIEAQVNLPNPCIAPIIFVTSPTGSWFAATGF